MKKTHHSSRIANSFWGAVFDWALSTTAQAKPARNVDRSRNQPQSMMMVHRVCSGLRDKYKDINNEARLAGHSFTSPA